MFTKREGQYKKLIELTLVSDGRGELNETDSPQ